MRRHARPDRPARPRGAAPQLLVGLLIMGVGVLMLVDRTDVITSAVRLLRFWPLALVVVGASMLTRRRDANGRFWGVAWLGIGSWLLLNRLGIVRVGFWELFWPLLLMLIGLNLIRQGVGTGPSTTKGDAADGGRRPAASGNLFAVMSESARTVNNELFARASMTAFMGACVLDLRQARLGPGHEAVVDIFGIMSGHEIIVPNGWAVVPDVVQFLAAIEDKRKPAFVDPAVPPLEPQPRIVLRGFLVMAGITIKS